ncbi:MAG TPA: peptidoglycan synthetase, partial [Salinivirgaceae bacterium]|nr:peptidoglycan synthetase [Salinivirgaceae bacterium]
LHTFSSLNRKFIPHYSNTLDKADKAFVYFNSDVLKHKSMPEIDPAFVAECFKHHNLEVYTDNSLMFEQIFREWRSGAVVLLMSSGNFGGYDLQLAISN